MNFKKWLGLSVLLVAFMVLSACGTAVQQTEGKEGNIEQTNAQAAEATEENQVSGLETNVDIHQNGELVAFDVTLQNNSSDEIQLTFPNGQQIEISVTNQNNEHVYTYSINKDFVDAIQNVKIPAGEKIEWNDEWLLNDDISSGEYIATVQIVASHLNGEELVDQKELQVEQTFQIENNRSNNAFRNINVRGEKGEYIVTGEARVFEGVFFYSIEEGHEYLVEEAKVEVKNGAPAWEPFELSISIPEDQLPINGTVTLELFEKSAKDDSVTNLYFVKLEEIGL